MFEAAFILLVLFFGVALTINDWPDDWSSA
jgi:hypothetical protein